MGIASGAAWMLLLRGADRALGITSTVVLARLLVPGDFGIVAMAMSVIALIELGSAFSFDMAIIQRRDPTPDHYNTAWTMTLLFATVCAVAIALLAYPSGSFYNEPRLPPVMLALAFGTFLAGLENIGVVNFRRSMNFSREFSFLFSKRIVGFVVTLALAVIFRSYWALVIGTLSRSAAGVVLSYLMEPYRPRLSFKARDDLVSFSGWMFLNNVLSVGLARLPHFTVGRLSGSTWLGTYTVASEIGTLPATELAAPVSRAVFPGYSRVQHDPTVLRQTFLDVLGATTAIALPASVGLALVAAPLIDVLLGDQWTNAVVLVQIFALSGLAQSFGSNLGLVYLAFGRTRLMFVFAAIRAITLLATIAWLYDAMGPAGAALSEALAFVVPTLVSFFMLPRLMPISCSAIASALWRPVVASLAMTGGLEAFRVSQSWLAGAPAVAQLLVLVALGVVLYAVALGILWAASGRPRGIENVVVDRIRALRRR